jgi:hypothetical protein
LIDQLDRHYRLVPKFEKREKLTPLQAADLAAYEQLKALPEWSSREFKHFPRVPFARLMQLPTTNKSFLRGGIEHACRLYGVPLRTNNIKTSERSA